MRLVLRAAGLSAAAWYDRRESKGVKKPRGPKPVLSDEVVLEAIPEDLATSKFHSEG